MVFSSPTKLTSCFMIACKHLIATVPCGKDFQRLNVPCVKNALLGRTGSGEGHEPQAAPPLFHLLCQFLPCKRLRKVCSLSFLQVACDCRFSWQTLPYLVIFFFRVNRPHLFGNSLGRHHVVPLIIYVALSSSVLFDTSLELHATSKHCCIMDFH